MEILRIRVQNGILTKECPYKEGVMIASLDCQRCEHYVEERSHRGLVMPGRIPDIFSTHSYDVSVFCKADEEATDV